MPRNPFGFFSNVDSDTKRYWIPSLLGIGTAITLFGVSLINLRDINTWSGWLDIFVGLFMVWRGATWSTQIRHTQPVAPTNTSLVVQEDRQSIPHKDVLHEVITDIDSPYYMGGSVRFSVRMKNQLDEPCVRKFYYLVQLPDGMTVHRPHYPIEFQPHEVKTVPLGDPIFLGFLGIFRLVILTGEAERELIENGHTSLPITFQTLFAGYSRDREGHEIQKKMVDTTKQVGRLTIALIVLTAALVTFSITGWLIGK